jgi:hypothetical protein
VIKVLDAAVELQTVCTCKSWQFCFIGGLAVQRWGEPRTTHDADLTLLTGFGGEAAYVDALLARFAARRGDARDFALRYRVLLLRSSNGIPLDIALGAMPFEENSIARSSLWQVTDTARIRTCSAEDLVVHKVFAARERDWLDVEGILLRQGARLDVRQVKTELEPLLTLKEDGESGPRLWTLCRKCGVRVP